MAGEVIWWKICFSTGHGMLTGALKKNVLDSMALAQHLTYSLCGNYEVLGEAGWLISEHTLPGHLYHKKHEKL
jgi:hypothetical protein